ncbi:MAG: glycosyltransferase family 4 protein [Gammaproteobacteria bacterium]|nr:glycosyltransferase family 4 protein [Gammaproteobacteria bacterium]
MTRRLSVCFAAPGHTLLSTAGSTRNILATATALSEWADVTLAFRNVAESLTSADFRVETIAAPESGDAARDDVAIRGLNPLSHYSYLNSLRSYASCNAERFDVIFEKGWRFSGFLAHAFRKHGVEAILIENDARFWTDPVRDVRGALKYVAHFTAQQLAGYCSRRVDVVVAETEQLKSALIAGRGLRPERIEVVPLGVDHAVFHPRDSAAARAELGISPAANIMLYVGGMDQYHDLSALLEALRDTAPPGLEIHLVGDGEYRGRYENLARGLTVPVVFHGQVNHHRVPSYIAAADLCLAPYQTKGFFRNQVAFSTLKIPEYMACEKPVISVPSGHILQLIEEGVTGFLFDNEVPRWRTFLEQIPTREQLARMGKAAGPSVAALSWSATARKYLDLVHTNPSIR